MEGAYVQGVLWYTDELVPSQLKLLLAVDKERFDGDIPMKDAKLVKGLEAKEQMAHTLSHDLAIDGHHFSILVQAGQPIIMPQHVKPKGATQSSLSNLLLLTFPYHSTP